MGFVIGLLTFLMILDCVVLVLLILVQLPKKEAGAGLAFGGSASDALFGAGSGNVLTKITKYSATIFFVMALLLSILMSRYHGQTSSSFQQKLSQPLSAPVTPAAPGKSSSSGPITLPPVSTNTGNALTSQPQAEGTNIPAAPATAPANPAPKK
jgi:preprotein translocase subunit SecG